MTPARAINAPTWPAWNGLPGARGDTEDQVEQDYALVEQRSHLTRIDGGRDFMEWIPKHFGDKRAIMPKNQTYKILP